MPLRSSATRHLASSPATTKMTWSLKTNNTSGMRTMTSRNLSTGPPAPLFIKSCQSLAPSTAPELVGSPHSKLHNVVWRDPVQNIYIVKKPWNDAVLAAMVQFINFIHAEYPSLNVVVSSDVAEELKSEYLKQPGSKPRSIYTGSVEDIVAKTDLIVVLGGDGTTLRAVSAFSNSRVPPVLSFALGTLGFLLPFDFAHYKKVFRSVYESRSKALHRTRLECHVVRRAQSEERERQGKKPEQVRRYELEHYKQHHNATMLHAMNDVSLHRGSQPNLMSLDIYIDSEFLTTTTADGLVFASPTGSTAYSLSSGGSIVNPLVPCILLTPVCPRSLSFRPLILPTTSHIMVKLPVTNRNSSINLNIDGIPQAELHPGDELHLVSENGTIYIPGKHQPPQTLAAKQGFDDILEPGHNVVRENSMGIYCIAKTENDWTKGINELLGFNKSFKGKMKI
ncbi:uncharacterized protein CXQ87_005162 [Candidozyma duobushaemuli]|uniref:Uncharacterized protein n=2 Tax=Candidozyma TaxID=3303203 RepID=A0ABX8I9S4_9ASCO|nr:uncharacterized protein CXQ87_005162 [[Candida] duobushaemulonis]PVH14886.1 hypothetical protein CXQ87_005162 [[Candida] duobushaemulonis]QWU90031.1 hypothetical protein CA3LBN_004389 [[Candida] haemuloni]